MFFFNFKNNIYKKNETHYVKLEIDNFTQAISLNKISVGIKYEK